MLYCGKNRKNQWKASFDKSKISKFDDIFETDLKPDLVHNNRVYMIAIYNGYSYDYYYSKIEDDFSYINECFHSITSAKKHSLWLEKECLSRLNPDLYHITNRSIASDDNGKEFIHGDIMDDKFNIRIINVPII